MLTFFTCLRLQFGCCTADTDLKCSLMLLLIWFELRELINTFTVTIVTGNFFPNNCTEIFKSFKSFCITLIALLGSLDPFCS